LPFDRSSLTLRTHAVLGYGPPTQAHPKAGACPYSIHTQNARSTHTEARGNVLVGHTSQLPRLAVVEVSSTTTTGGGGAGAGACARYDTTHTPFTDSNTAFTLSLRERVKRRSSEYSRSALAATHRHPAQSAYERARAPPHTGPRQVNAFRSRSRLAPVSADNRGWPGLCVPRSLRGSP
jgi:hypothetical protein